MNQLNKNKRASNFNKVQANIDSIKNLNDQEHQRIENTHLLYPSNLTHPICLELEKNKLEYQVLVLRHGLFNGRRHWWVDIGVKLDTNREGARVLEKAAHARLMKKFKLSHKELIELLKKVYVLPPN